MSHRLQPAFPADQLLAVHDCPASQCALARIRPGQPPVAERFELYLGPLELANGYHELTDADEQRVRFESDLDRRGQACGGAAAWPTASARRDVEGLPACAGVALGVDRLLMAMLGSVPLPMYWPSISRALEQTDRQLNRRSGSAAAVDRLVVRSWA